MRQAGYQCRLTSQLFVTCGALQATYPPRCIVCTVLKVFCLRVFLYPPLFGFGGATVDPQCTHHRRMSDFAVYLYDKRQPDNLTLRIKCTSYEDAVFVLKDAFYAAYVTLVMGFFDGVSYARFLFVMADLKRGEGSSLLPVELHATLEAALHFSVPHRFGASLVHNGAVMVRSSFDVRLADVCLPATFPAAWTSVPPAFCAPPTQASPIS